MRALLLAPAALVLVLVGCTANLMQTGETPAIAPSPQPWGGVTDGTWTSGDFGFGETVTSSSSDYTFTVIDVPSMLTADGGETVTVTGVLRVDRVRDRDSGEDISSSDRVWFRPGNWGIHDEQYGSDNSHFECENEQITVGESTSCSVSFTVPVADIQDFHWSVNGRWVAAWPGQVL